MSAAPLPAPRPTPHRGRPAPDPARPARDTRRRAPAGTTGAPSRPASPRPARARTQGAPARPARPAPGAQETPRTRPAHLRLVRAVVPGRLSLPLVLTVLLLLVTSLVASMLLNAAMADTAFRMREASIELDIVNDHIDTLRSDLQRAAAPGTLAQRARELGMVPAGAPGVVDLDAGTVSGGQPAAEATTRQGAPASSGTAGPAAAATAGQEDGVAP